MQITDEEIEKRIKKTIYKLEKLYLLFNYFQKFNRIFNKIKLFIFNNLILFLVIYTVILICIFKFFNIF